VSFADKLSISRIILVPIFVSFLIYSKSRDYFRYLAIGVFFLAIISDFLDGLVARIKKEKSEIGKVVDPLADKVLLITAFLSLKLLDFNIPLWVVLIVVSRDFIILLGIAILHFLKVEVPIFPSIWGKLTTFFQMITVLVVLMNVKFSFLIWNLAVIFTLISGIGYIKRGISCLNLAESKGK